MAKQMSYVEDAKYIVRGLLMGGADVIPGVSGGTVALILGIYERLVTSISRFDLKFMGLLRSRRWAAAASHVDLRFLIALGSGILLGIVTLGSLMNHLLTSETRSLTLATLFGAILATCWLVGRLVRLDNWPDTIFCPVFGLAAAMLTYWISSASSQSVVPSHAYLFVCGIIGICAMILPGISGALILLVLGVYVHLTDYLQALIHGTISADAIVTVLVFGSGCAIGLLSFSKLLRWLLAYHKSLTMTVMCGFMLGALKKIWPFQNDLTPQIHEVKQKQYEFVWPDMFDSHVVACIIAGLLGFALILGLDWVTDKFPTTARKSESLRA